MFTVNRILAVIGLSATVGLAMPATAEDLSADTVVATVNGTDITVGNMVVVYAGLPEQYRQIAAHVLFDGIRDQLIEQQLLADALEGGLSTQGAISLENETRAIRAAEAMTKVANAAVTEEALQEAYAASYGAAAPEIEYHAAHILVETEDDAKEIIKLLEDGAEFAELAKEKSTGPSGPNGGDLGWFGAGRMVKPFEDAVVALEPGTVSEPVQTQFGWHVIKMLETRTASIPTLDIVRSEMVDRVQSVAVGSYLDELKKAGEISIPDLGEFDPATIQDAEILKK